ncbi:MAG TPA: ABC transporter substrate-binding protein [Anaeromyxobacteraceae bacterium]|nr:ABC transporter substrate-binding protein [Anaeromyxobacteraceae bacterium]
MPRFGLRLLALLVLSLAGCPKRVVVNGQEMPASAADDLARAEFEAVRAQAAGLPPAEAAQRLEAVASRYRGVETAADALFDAAAKWREAGQPDRAAAALRRLVLEHPLYRRATEAKYRLALADVAAGRPADGLSTLSSLWPRLPAGEQPQAARAAAEAAMAARAWPDAVRWLSLATALSQGAERQAARARLAEVVDGWLSFLEVARLREELPADAPAQEVLTMKLARIQLHLRDHAQAAELAREVFLRWPDGPYADDAKAIVERIGRLTFVRPNVIGVAIPLSGTFRRWGEAILQGIGIALGEGSGLRLAVRDTRGEADGAVAAVESLALEEGAIVILGGVTNAEAERAAATAEELQVPFLSLSKQEGVTAAGPHVFQNMLTASAQARALAEYAMARNGMKRFGILFPDVPYGVELANAFWDEVEARGGEVRAAETYAIDRTTFTPLVKSMVGKLELEERADYRAEVEAISRREGDPYRRRKALERARDRLPPVVDFEAVFIPDFAKNVKLIAPALAVEDVVTATCDPEEVARIAKTTGRPDLRPVQLLGSNGWGGDPTLYDISTGAPGRHLKCAVFVDGFYAGSRRPETRRFVEAFGRKYGGAVPGILEASAHDAAGMARLVIEQGRAQGRPQARDGLAALRGFRGATGDITMRPDRTPEKPLFFLAIGPDGLRELEPAEVAPPGAGGDAP